MGIRGCPEKEDFMSAEAEEGAGGARANVDR